MWRKKGGGFTLGLQYTLEHINDHLLLSAENKKGFSCPKLQSSHGENRGRNRWMKRMDTRRKGSEEAGHTPSCTGFIIPLSFTEV